MGFKGREREGSIEVDQFDGRDKVPKLKSRQTCVKHNFYKIYFYFSFEVCYYLHDYFI